ncbi:transglycosylase SLT domain-containing protein [Xenorhabdus sp. XENO-1]|uniref:transglycosylase SLT domain-containing protein n=1 Tax=Xenorhabdus bovienii TaxID=40576 RepID=UPI0020CA39B6|nr:transglycosylase SLT domain-containing protein [Xenorhabdus bovienii]MCP9269134.1 transglycosylase SLT domain-containing protein [Xenorhabdus bovienii subsp. africana]
MKKTILFLYTLCFSAIAVSSDCFEMAGRDYRIDPDLLRSISWNESRFKKSAIGVNPTTGYGVGLMQIDSQNFEHLNRFGITSYQLLNDECMNAYTGAYFLALSFKKLGVNWDAVGAYNAGFKKSKKQAERRYKYAKKIHDTYMYIKWQKKQQQTTTH